MSFRGEILIKMGETYNGAAKVLLKFMFKYLELQWEKAFFSDRHEM